MTISSETRKAGPYTGNGSQTSFPFTFKVFTTADVQVIRTDLSGAETTLVLGTDYSVTLNSNQDSNPGGSITTTTAPATGFLITLTSQVGATQSTDLTNQGGFYPNVINTALDKLTILVQQLKEQVGRAVKTNISSSTTPDQLINTLVTSAASASTSATAAAASATAAQNTYNAFQGTYYGTNTVNPTVDPLGNAPTAGDLYFNTVANAMRVYSGSAWQDVVQGVSFPYQIFSGTGSQTAFTLSATPGSLGNLEVFISGLRQRPGTDYTWSGGTTLTFTTAPVSGTNNIFVRWLTTQAINVPADGSVTPAKLSTGGPTWNANAALGIGTTLSTWIADRSVVQLGNTSALYNAGAYTYLTNNIYIDVGNVTRYIQANFAAMYQIANDGTHNFYTSPSGAANAQITVLNRVLGIDTSGNLLMLGALRSANASPPVFQNTSGTEIGQLCRAWANFNGSAATIRASFNVSSITRNAAGDYSVNFTNALADANYSAVGSTQGIAGLFSINNTGGLTTTSARLSITNSTSAVATDVTQACIAIFR